ncbi:MAG: hypothetical protein WCK31_02025 [bacterium]
MSIENTESLPSGRNNIELAIYHSKTPAEKAFNAERLINHYLGNNNRHAAVHALEFVKAASLPLKQYNEAWVLGQYDASISDGDFQDAYFTAITILKNSEKMFAPVSTLDSEGNTVTNPIKISEEWLNRVEFAFNKHLEIIDKDPKADILTLKFLANRSDSYTEAIDPKMIRRIKVRVVEIILKDGDKLKAAYKAKSYGLDLEYKDLIKEEDKRKKRQAIFPNMLIAVLGETITYRLAEKIEKLSDSYQRNSKKVKALIKN